MNPCSVDRKSLVIEKGRSLKLWKKTNSSKSPNKDCLRIKGGEQTENWSPALAPSSCRPSLRAFKTSRPMNWLSRFYSPPFMCYKCLSANRKPVTSWSKAKTPEWLLSFLYFSQYKNLTPLNQAPLYPFAYPFRVISPSFYSSVSDRVEGLQKGNAQLLNVNIDQIQNLCLS